MSTWCLSLSKATCRRHEFGTSTSSVTEASSLWFRVQSSTVQSSTVQSSMAQKKGAALDSEQHPNYALCIMNYELNQWFKVQWFNGSMAQSSMVQWLLTQSFNIAINDVYISCLRVFWQTWHTHDVAHDDNDHLCSVVDDYVADVEVEVFSNAVCFWICRE